MSTRILFAVVLIVSLSSVAHAQLSGSIGIGGETTNNIQSLDTTAPDNLILPAFELGYGWQIGGPSRLSFAASYTPSFYTINTPLSYNATSLGITGTFYLSNVAAISAETNAGSASEFQSHPLPGFGVSHILSPMANSDFGFPSARGVYTLRLSSSYDENDSLVNLAVSALYTLSGELDSTDIATKGISKLRIQQLEDLRDSISDVLSTIADLLDSTGYSESAAQIVLVELQNLRGPLARLLPLTKPFHTDPGLLDVAIRELKQAKPESDFLSTATAAAPGNSSVNHKLDSVLQQLSPTSITHGDLTEKESVCEPAITLVQSSTRLRDFGYNDVSIHEDADDSGATTLATALTIPLSWSSHTATSYSAADSTTFGSGYLGNPNDNHSFAFGAALEGLTSASFSLRGSYDYTRATYPFDSIYSNSENRVGLVPRFGIGATTVLFGEVSIGFRNYLNPLTVTLRTGDTVFGPRGKILKINPTTAKTADSKFTQYSFGAGMTQLLGERSTVGVVAAFNRSPNLRAYITTAQVVGTGRRLRGAVQVADDDYTYDLDRYGVVTNNRIFWDMDLGCDLSYEHRLYGSAYDKKGDVLLGGEGRTEDGWYFHLSLSKLFPFKDRIVGVFNCFMIETKLDIASVAASQSLYSYNASSFTVTTSLGF